MVFVQRPKVTEELNILTTGPVDLGDRVGLPHGAGLSRGHVIWYTSDKFTLVGTGLPGGRGQKQGDQAAGEIQVGAEGGVEMGLNSRHAWKAAHGAC